MKAYVLIQTTPEERTIADELLTIAGIRSAVNLQGPYDAIAEADWAPDDVGLQVTLDAINQLPGVLRALVAPVIRDKQPSDARAA